MKSRILMLVTAMSLFAALTSPVRLTAQGQKKEQPQQYSVTDLGTLGGTFPQPFGVNNKRWVNGNLNLTGNQNTHAFLWRDGVMTDLGTLGGPNSGAPYPLNKRGDVAGTSDISTRDPLGETFCGTPWICVPVFWQDGLIVQLPTLGGNNGIAFGINNRGQMAGEAENTTHDKTCLERGLPPGLQYKPVVWEKGKIQELPTPSGDPDGQVIAINDKGQAVGGSGHCAQFTQSSLNHALLWQRRDKEESENADDRDGWTVTNLGNLGGAMNNSAQAINNHAQVVGGSDLPGDTTGHAFLWTEDDGMQDLGTLPGDVASGAGGINSEGQVIGTSADGNGNLRAFLWQSGVMTDLNSFIPAGSSLFLLDAYAINDRGDIVGDALQTSTGEVHAFLATPTTGQVASGSTLDARGEGSERPKFTLPENVRKMLGARLGHRYPIPALRASPRD